MKATIDGHIPVMTVDDRDRANCPTCGMSIRVERRTDKKAFQYVPRIAGEDVAQVLQPQDEETSKKLRKLRKGKKTVAMVGLAPTSCSLAPFEDKDVEIWALNETHAFQQWFKRWDRWFQIHDTQSWKRYIAKRDVRGHFDWLKTEHYANEDIVIKQPFWKRIFKRNEYEHYKEQVDKRLKPIYMQYWQPIVPNSVAYPIHEVCEIVFKDFRRGDKRVKYFTSTLAYMIGIAILENFERIEIYGFELADEIEYVKQKACAEFWIGYALGRGIEVYTPPRNQILFSALYGGDEQGAGW